jgi:hypothetical protein
MKSCVCISEHACIMVEVDAESEKLKKQKKGDHG